MNWDLPPAIEGHPQASRTRAALQACVAAGDALLAMRGTAGHAVEVGTQLKTPLDRAAEGWVLGYLEPLFPADAMLAEERHAASECEWRSPGRYWTIDALDGTRSFVDGYPGFCVQAAYVDESGPELGVICEPVAAAVYVGVRGGGAWHRTGTGPWQRMRIALQAGWPARPRFVDSTRPRGAVGVLLGEHDGRFVECGSIGLKICRVGAGQADIFAKELTFRLWDVAPGEILLREAGGEIGCWSGQRLDYHAGSVEWRNLLAAPAGLFPSVVAALAVQQL
jgi:3'(2'), 5'-bisphosphate nucleotidase